jgi:hypothetical protein
MGITGAPNEREPIRRYKGQPRPPFRGPRPIFAPREINFFSSLFVVTTIAAIVFFGSLAWYENSVTIESEVVVVVTVRGTWTSQNDIIQVWIDYEGSSDNKAGSDLAPLLPNGNATSTFKLTRIGPYTIHAKFHNDPDGTTVTKDLELGPDDDGKTFEILLRL